MRGNECFSIAGLLLDEACGGTSRGIGFSSIHLPYRGLLLFCPRIDPSTAAGTVVSSRIQYTEEGRPDSGRGRSDMRF